MKKWGFKYWETYVPVSNLIIVRYLLDTASIHELPILSINFVLTFPQTDLDVYVFMKIYLGMGIDVNIGE